VKLGRRIVRDTYKVEFHFIKSKSDDNNKRMEFFQYFHNNFAYPEFNLIKRENKIPLEVKFDNILMSYGCGAVPAEYYDEIKMKDVFIQSYDVFDFSYLEGFSGTVAVHIKGYEENYTFMII
jgi:hypothetical protein